MDNKKKSLATCLSWLGVFFALVFGQSIDNDYSSLFQAIGIIIMLIGSLLLIISSRKQR